MAEQNPIKAGYTTHTTNEKILAEFIFGYAAEHGRIAPFEYLEQVVNTRMSSYVEFMKEDKPDWKIDDLILKYKEYFYTFTIEGYKYISLSRNYAFSNPRLAKSLEAVIDKAKNKIIGFGKDIKIDYVELLDEIKQNGDYEFAQVSLTVLEIFSVIDKSVDKQRDKVMISKLLQKFRYFSISANTVLHFCSKGSDEELLKNFLELFKETFEIQTALVSLDRYLFDGMTASYELDFLMSCAGGCILKGMTSIADITNELTEAAARARLKFIEVTSELVISLLEKYKEFCFLPGDGSVWFSYLPEMTEKVSTYLINFFIVHLKDNLMHFTESMSVIEAKDRALRKELRANSIMISSFLFLYSNIFKFEDGNISLLPEAERRFPRLDLTPLEVPITAIFKTYHPTIVEEMRFFVGCIVQIGRKSAVIHFPEHRKPACKIFMGEMKMAYAFCHVEKTLLGCSYVRDFSLYLKVGQFVKFYFIQHTAIDLMYPMYNVVVNIDSFRHPETNKSIRKIRKAYLIYDYRNPSPETSSSDSSEYTDSTESGESDDESKPSTSRSGV